MNYENIKSTILLVLIISSVLLTWTLWTYQPSYDIMKDSEKTVEEVTLGEKKDIKKIVRPERLFFHQDSKHYGTFDSLEIDQAIKEMSRWNFSEFEDISNQVKNIPSFIFEKSSVDIIFPDIVPLNVYRSTLKLSDEDTPNKSFDRIVIELEDSSEAGGFVYFISSVEHIVLRASVPESYIQNYKESFRRNVSGNEKFSEYVPINQERFIMLRKEPVKMAMYNFLIEKLPPEKFRDALFSDPNTVKKNYSSLGEEYTDSTALLSVNYEANTVSYVKTVSKENEKLGKVENLLTRSIDFINSHGGWTDNYRYVGMDDSEQFILFRMYDLSGYPIYSDNGMSEILQMWGSSEINKYYRNNFTLGRRVQATEITLASGVTILEEVKKIDGLDLELLQDLSIGYRMAKVQARLVHLEPAWFYKYNDQWFIVPSSGSGGLKNGLE